jgi:hypothetical protein
MAIAVCVALAFIAPSAAYWMARERRKKRRAADDSLRRVFRPRELRELDTASTDPP